MTAHELAVVELGRRAAAHAGAENTGPRQTRQAAICNRRPR